MGLLMRRGIPLMLVLAAVLSLPGCSPFRLQVSVRSGEGGWKMYGGNAGRTNVAPQALVPPLTLRWEYDASAGFGPYSASVADSLIFVGNLRGEVHAIHLRTGEAAGVRSFGSAVIGTPVANRQTLYVALSREEKSLVAYDLDNGIVLWEKPFGDIESAPLLMGERLYVAALDGKISCVDASNGAALWTRALPTSRRSSAVRSSPASDGDVLVVGCDNGALYALDVRDGTARWTATTGASIAGSPAIATGLVFVGSLDGTFYAFDAASGKTKWSRPLGSPIFASPAVDDGRVFIGTTGGTFAALSAGTGEILWRASFGSVINAAPLISGAVVYVAGLDKTLRAFSASAGEPLWQYTAKGRLRTMPVIARGFLLLLTEDRLVLGFSEEGGR